MRQGPGGPSGVAKPAVALLLAACSLPPAPERDARVDSAAVPVVTAPSVSPAVARPSAAVIPHGVKPSVFSELPCPSRQEIGRAIEAWASRELDGAPHLLARQKLSDTPDVWSLRLSRLVVDEIADDSQSQSRIEVFACPEPRATDLPAEYLVVLRFVQHDRGVDLDSWEVRGLAKQRDGTIVSRRCSEVEINSAFSTVKNLIVARAEGAKPNRDDEIHAARVISTAAKHAKLNNPR